MKILSLILLLTLPISAIAKPVIDVTKIAGKSKVQVEKILGTPTKTTKTKYGEKLSYKKGDTEIVFINGLADWITVEDINDVPFNKKAIISIGLEESHPVKTTDWELQWENLQGLRSISLFKGKNMSDYIYIKVKTK